MFGFHFISYSPTDAQDFVYKLYDALLGGAPSIPAWLDKRDLQQPGQDWDEQLVEAIRACRSLIFVLTPASVEAHSGCKKEWTRALKYKKPIVALLLHPEAEMPFRLEPRPYIDFSGPFKPALARLRQHLQGLDSPAGKLQDLKYRLADAQRDLRRAIDPPQQARVQADVERLQQQIAAQQRVVDDPHGAAQRVEESIQRGLERERQPRRPASGRGRGKFINPPPDVAPAYFQDRYDETRLMGRFLQNETQRLLTIVGRGGIGKTAPVCRLLKALESGRLPDDGGRLPVDGIVYLSAIASRRVNFPNLYADLAQLLPSESAGELDALYKNPQASTEAKMRALLAAFPPPGAIHEPPLPHGRVILLLDNFEDVLDPKSRRIADDELAEALAALLKLPPHAVKVIITTRLAPLDLALVQPGRQIRLDLDKGLAHPYAENILREMDIEGQVGLRDAPDELLAEARRRTRGYPRALEALFAILSADRDASLAEILAAAGELLPDNVTEVLVGEAFNRLDPAARQVMQALAIYARPVTPTAVDYLLQDHSPGLDSASSLKQLVNMQFVRKEAGRYYLHPVDSAYALGRVPRGPAGGRRAAQTGFTQLALYHRGADYFKQARQPRENWKTIEDLAPQLAEFDLRCAAQDYDTAAWVLREIFHYLLLWGHYRLLIEKHERLQGKLADPELKSWSVGNLGTAYWSMGQYQKAIKSYEQALSITQEQKNRQGEGAWLGNLGNCYLNLGQTARAIDFYEQALAIAREIGDRLGEGNHLGNLGSCYTNLGQTARAIDFYEQALAIARETGDRPGEGTHLGNLGNRYADLGQTARAIDFYEQALVIDREVGHRKGEGIRLGNLGTCYADLGQTARASDFCEQALAIAREIGDRPGEGHNLGNLAEVLVDQGRYAEAIQRALESIRIGEEIRSPKLCNYYNGYLALAQLYAGDLPAARAAAEAARQYDEPQNNHSVLALLGLIALRQGAGPAAREAFNAAVAQADQMLAHSAQNYGALDARGLALCGLALGGDVESAGISGAIDAYRAARAINREAGVVGRVLRLFGALAAADTEGVLAGVWENIEPTAKKKKKAPRPGKAKPEAARARAEFDVFLAHNSQAKPAVRAISEALKRRGLKPWLDEEQIPPGRWFQKIIQAAISKAGCAAIFIGPEGLGKWQELELRAFVSQCVEADIPVIPVLLPGVEQIPPELPFLKELNWVSFGEKIDEAEALDKLEWGITGKRPE